MTPADSTYINPLTDFGFKYLFGQEENKQFLLSFLNAVLQGERVITEVEFVDKEKIGENKNSRALIYDLHCKTEDGEKVIVEMQNRYQTHFRDRALYYLSDDIYHQGQKGDDWDYSLTPVYGIFLMNFDWREGEMEQLREDACLMNKRTLEIFSNKLAMTFLKIPMMVKDAENCKDTLEKWLYLLKHMDKMEAMPKVFMNDPVFRRLGKVAKVAALNDAELNAYNKSLKIYRDNYAIMKTERNEGYEEGIAEGIGIGEAKGRVKGREEGKMETMHNNALNMLKAGFDIDIIHEMIGLPIEEIKKLKLD